MSVGNTVEAIIGATLAPSFRKAFNEADKTAMKLGDSVKRLEATTASSQGLNKLKGQVANANSEFTKASRSLDSVNKRIATGERQTDALVEEWIAAETQFEKSKNKLNGLERELGQATQKSKQFDNNTDKLTESQKKLENQLGKTKAAQDRYNATMTRSNQLKSKSGSLAMASAGAGVAAYGIGRTLMAPLREGMEIEAAVSRAQAVLTNFGSFGSRDAAYSALGDTIRELGSTTAFNSQQVAEGAKYLIQAGFDADKTIAALPATLSLSKAGDLDLGQTANIMSNIMAPFKIAAEDSEMVADTLAAVITTSNTDITMLGESMKYVAPIAHTYGMTMAETAGMVGMLGNAGIQGTVAGNAMKTMMIRMSAPMPKAVALFKELGISAEDAAGKLRAPDAVLADLANAMSNANFTQAQQLESVRDVFGQEAMSAVSVLMSDAEQNGKDGSEALQKYLSTISAVADGQRGLAKDIAGVQQNNLKGDFTALGSTISGTFDNIYQSVMPTLRSVVQGLNTIVDGIRVWTKQNPFLTKTITLLAIGVGTLTAGLAVGLGVASAYTFAQSQLLRVNAALALSLGKTTASTSLLSTVMMTGSAASKKFAASMVTAGTAVKGFTIAGAKAKIMSVGTSLAGMAATAVTSAAGIGTALSAAGASLAGLGSAAMAFMVSNPIGWIIGAVVAVGLAVYKYWEPIKAFAKGVWEPVSETMGAVADSLSPVIDLFGAVFNAVGSVIGAITGLFSPVDKTADSLGKATDAGRGFGKVISFLLTPLRAVAWVVGKVASALTWVVEGITPVLTGIVSGVGTVVGFLFDVVAAPFKAVWSVVTGIASAIGWVVDGITTVLGGVWDVITSPIDAVMGAVTWVTDGIGSAFSTVSDWVGTAAGAVWDGLTWVADGVTSTIGGIVDTANSAVVQPIVIGVQDLGSGVLDGFMEGFEPIMEALEPVGELFNMVGNAIGSVVNALGSLFGGSTSEAQAGIEATNESMSTMYMLGKAIGTAFQVLLFPIRIAAEAIGAVASGIIWMVEGIGSIFSSIADAITAVGTSIYDAITYPFRKAYEIIGGIGETISDAWNWLWGDDDAEKKVTVTKVGEAANDAKFHKPESNVVEFTKPEQVVVQSEVTKPEAVTGTTSVVNKSDILQPVSNVTDRSKVQNSENVYNFEEAKDRAMTAEASSMTTMNSGTTQYIDKLEIKVDGAGDPQEVAERVYQRQQEEMFRAEREYNY